MYNDKYCDICNKQGAIRSKKWNKYLCYKHYEQYRKYGYAIDNNQRTINDKNNITIDGDIAYIDIYNNRNELIYKAIIDAVDVNKIKDKKWRVSIKRNKPYVVSKPSIYLSRFILNYNGDKEVDHINGNVLDNRKSNLRIISHEENATNLKHKNNNKLQVRGVSYSTRDNVYKSDFCFRKKRFYTHSWKTLEEAVYCRYCFENELLKYRYKGNDERILSIINNLSEDKKKEIEKYVKERIEISYAN